MPRANLRPVYESGPFREFECSICKVRFHGISKTVEKDVIAYQRRVGAEKAALFEKWYDHLRCAHARQWEFQQAKIAKHKVGT